MKKNGIHNFSVIIPARNEAESLLPLITRIRNLYQNAEIIVINDGSTDDTGDIAIQHADVHIHHPISLGNGAAIKAGARKASHNVLVMLDADGQHQPEDIKDLLAGISQGNSMVVGARSPDSQASFARKIANSLYNKLASYITGIRISDLTSGFRAVDRAKFMTYIELLPNGFSYPTTITMAFFRAGYTVKYVPIIARKRSGKSHIRIFSDGTRFFLIIMKIGTLYSPLKIFFPMSLAFFILGISYYTYTYTTSGQFTNMGALLFINSVLIFLIGLISEQITALMYLIHSRRINDDNQQTRD